MPIQAQEIRDFLARCRRIDSTKAGVIPTRTATRTETLALDDDSAPGWVDAGAGKNGTGELYSTLASTCSILIIQAGTKACMAHVVGSGEFDVGEVTTQLTAFFGTVSGTTKTALINRLVVTVCTRPANVENAPDQLLTGSVGVIIAALAAALGVDYARLTQDVAPITRIVTGLSGVAWTQYSAAWVTGSKLEIALVL